MADELRVSRPDFGAWLRAKLEAAKLTQTEITTRTGMTHSNLNAIINSGRHGKPIQPEEGTIRRLIPALLDLGLIESEEEAWAAAGYLPEGFKIVRETRATYQAEPPENFADWPQELQQALSYACTHLPPNVQRFIFGAWLEQLRPHIEVAEMTRQAEKLLQEREERIKQNRE
jgi:transcriptional regulator with XRE-family HTH domain